MIFTIGHSNRSLSDFIIMLQVWKIDTLVDVRSYPGSRRCPWFGKVELSKAVKESDIGYEHLVGLGGRRYKEDTASEHAGWRELSFRNYAAYAASSPAFQSEFNKLLTMCSEKVCAIMCSESLWWKCHRRIITDYLLVSGVKVNHIMSNAKCSDGELTKFAVAKGTSIIYPEINNTLFDRDRMSQ